MRVHATLARTEHINQSLDGENQHGNCEESRQESGPCEGEKGSKAGEENRGKEKEVTENKSLQVTNHLEAFLMLYSKKMKKMSSSKPRKVANMAKEYRFDYKKAKPNRFARRMKDAPLVAVIDPDVAKVFTTAEQVNKALRALISAMPKK